MAIVTVEQIQAQLNLPDGFDSDLLAEKIEAAQGHVERLLGYKIADEFGGEDQPDIPAPLVEAVKQLCAWWYEQREAAVVGHGAAVVPYSVGEIVAEYREYTF